MDSILRFQIQSRGIMRNALHPRLDLSLPLPLWHCILSPCWQKWLLLHFLCDFRFQEGLKTLRILDAVREYPHSFKKLLCYDDCILTAGVVEKIFRPELSVDGSTKRSTETEIYAWWLDYLQEVQGRIHCKCVSHVL